MRQNGSQDEMQAKIEELEAMVKDVEDKNKKLVDLLNSNMYNKAEQYKEKGVEQAPREKPRGNSQQSLELAFSFPLRRRHGEHGSLWQFRRRRWGLPLSAAISNQTPEDIDRREEPGGEGARETAPSRGRAESATCQRACPRTGISAEQILRAQRNNSFLC